MEIIPISDDKLKISLTRQDMDDLGLVYETMNYSDNKTKLALLSLLEKAKEDAGFSPRGARLFIEAYQESDGGCSLCFTIIRKPSKLSGNRAAIAPVVFEFAGVSALIEGACKAYEYYRHRIYKSSLYLLNGKYRLLVCNLDYSDRLSVYFLSEYAEKLGDDEILAAYTAEHGKEIIADSAIETLAKYFG